MALHVARARLRLPPRLLPLVHLARYLHRRCARLLRFGHASLHGRAVHAGQSHHVHLGRYLNRQRGAQAEFGGGRGVLSEVPVRYHLSVLDDVVGCESVDFDVLQEPV